MPLLAQEMMGQISSESHPVNPMMCPCDDLGQDTFYPGIDTHEEDYTTYDRWLQQTDDNTTPTDTKLWEILYSVGVLLLMTIALLSDRIGADSVMLMALTAFLVAQIIDIPEGLAGFANEGLLTVMVLFVVAEGIGKTGALDWYMAKLLGRPTVVADAQLRLMVPIAIVSAFLNNTPVVAVLIPIVQRWGKNIRISPQLLLIPLSFASILGGTCTLIGTSTNLVVAGLLQERYPTDSSLQIGLFDLGQYGVPIAMAGIAYILLTSPWLLAGGPYFVGTSKDRQQTNALVAPQEDLLLGARVSPWSPAVGRTVQRSGLRDTGGIYLVSVHRAATGNVHRAVGPDFVVQVGDVLYFTGLRIDSSFGEFCEEHGLEVVTTEQSLEQQQQPEAAQPSLLPTTTSKSPLQPNALGVVTEGPEESGAIASSLKSSSMPPTEIGMTKESLLEADEAERSRSITRMIDMIRGNARDEPQADQDDLQKKRPPRPGVPRSTTVTLDANAPAKIVVTNDQEHLVVIGVNAIDRPGLLLDISKGLLRLELTLRHTEAAVIGNRSISIWRCELLEQDELPDLEAIWSVLSALLEGGDSGIVAVKTRGLRVIRALVTKTSSLVGQSVSEASFFRKRYKAAIVALQKGGRNVSLGHGNTTFGPGDVLVLQASEDSPLLVAPPPDFYSSKQQGPGASGDSVGGLSRKSSRASFYNIFRSKSHHSFENLVNLAAGRSKPSSDPSTNTPLAVPLGAETDHNAASEENKEEHGSSHDSGDDYFIASSDDEDHGENDDAVSGSAVELTGMESVATPALANEDVWRDLQVFSANTGGPSEGGGGGDGSREFLAAMTIAPHSKLAKRTVAEIGLDKLPGVFLVSIDRPNVATRTNRADNHPNHPIRTAVLTLVPSGDGSVGGIQSEAGSMPTAEPTFTTISPDTPLKEGDVLWFAGSASALGDLRKIPGLASYESEEVEKINEKVHDRRLVEAVVARRGPLVGKTVKEVRFRTRYGAAVIAVHRDGNRVHDHPGNIKLQAGDVLLLEAGPTFIQRSVDNDRSFALLAEVEDSAPPRLRFLIPALLIAAAMLIVTAADVTSLLIAALVASILMVMLGILSEQEARDAVNWEVYITIACAFGIGTALVNSGVAGGVADGLVSVGEAVGMGGKQFAVAVNVGIATLEPNPLSIDAGLLGAVYLATFLISNVVTNNAAAALIFPIALDAAEQTGIDRVLMSYTLMLGASASFMSPFGYTTNLLIYGPGGYKYTDFLLIGTPMQFVLWILSIVFLTSGDLWWVTWLGSFAALVLVIFVQLGGASLLSKRPGKNPKSASGESQ